MTWRVTAIICHSAITKEGGHYWAYRRVPDTEKAFVHISDETITARHVTYDRFDDIKNAYMMVLERN